MSHRKRSDQFLEAMAGFERYLIVTHDNPDPDAIASGWAMHLLLSGRFGVPVRFVAGGAILRGENAHMVRLLEPPLELVAKLPNTKGAGVVLVDRQRLEVAEDQGDGADGVASRLAVIDHHTGRADRPAARFRDVALPPPRAPALSPVICVTRPWRRRGAWPRPWPTRCTRKRAAARRITPRWTARSSVGPVDGLTRSCSRASRMPR